MTRGRLVGTAATIALCWAPAMTAQTSERKPDAASLRGRSSFTWTQPELEFGLAHWDEIVPARTVQSGAVVRTLPVGRPIAALATGSPNAVALERYITEQYVAGLIVLQDGTVRLERYALGYAKDGRWMSQSVAKSVTSTLIGAALQDGFIRSLDDPVTRYIQDLRGSAYDSVTVRHLLTMTSGVRWNETYTDSTSDVARFHRDPVTPGLNATVSYMRRLQREAPAGTTWVYKSGETHLLGVLLAAATGKPVSEYLSETIWKPYGMQQEASWSLDRTQHELGGCCLQASLRDFARFGQFVLDGGRIGSRRIVPEGWFEAATKTQVATGRAGSGYGYQWWTADDGTFSAYGIHGQMIHVDPTRRLVVAMNSAWPEAISPERSAARRALLHMLARVLDAEKTTKP